MHTVRNRLARKGRNAGQTGIPRPPRDDAAFMLRQATPPQTCPADLIVPPHRGAVITASDWPAPGLALLVEPSPELHTPELNQPQPKRPGAKAARKAARRAAALARAQRPAAALSPAAAPLCPDPPTQPFVRDKPECAQVLALPPEPAAVEEPPAPVEVALRPDVPLPSTRALVPRRQGFIDILAFALRDSGRRLARWSSARRRADDMKDKLAKAEARMRAMEAQLAALQAIQQRVRT
jgi:hypothetical protein